MEFWICNSDWERFDGNDVFNTEDEAINFAVEKYRFTDAGLCLIVQVEDYQPYGTWQVCTAIVMGNAVYLRPSTEQWVVGED